MRSLIMIGLLAVVGATDAGAQSALDRSILATLDSAIPPGVLPHVDQGEDGVTRMMQGAIGNFARYVRDNDRRAAEKALFALDQAATRRKTWAWPSYAMARVFYEFHQRNAPVLDSDGKVEGEPNVTAMWRHLATALGRDDKLDRARHLLVDLAYAGGDRELMPAVRQAIEHDLHVNGTSPRSWIVYGRALRTERKYEFALGAFERAALMGGDASVTALERARTLRALGDTAGAILAYWSGADDMTAEGRALYHQDLEWIVSADSLEGFRATPIDSTATWLRRFWAERDAAAVRAPNERLVEHLRRWVVVHRAFRVPVPWKRNFYTRFWGIAGAESCIASASRWVDSLPLHSPTMAGDPRAREPLLDHRGFIYMRHGEPYARTDVPIAGELWSDHPDSTSVTIASWVYWVDGAWRAFHFGGSDVFGAHAPTTLRSYLPFDYGAWMALANEMPQYARAALLLDPERGASQPKSCYSILQTAVREHRADAGVAISTDSDSPYIAHPWDAPLRFFALGTESDRNGRALITFALPAGVLRADSLDGGAVRYPVSFRIVAFEPTSGRSLTIDTVRNFRNTRPLARGQYLTGWFELPLTGGTWQLSVRVHQGDPEAGAYALRRGLVLDRGERLALSDIVTGLAGSPERWTAGGETFPLNTLGAWRTGRSVEVYYEVRGLGAGDPYTSTLQVLPTDRRIKGSVSVRSQELASGPLTPVRRTLGLARLPAGTYRLVVTVEAAGQTVRREQQVLVVDRN